MFFAFLLISFSFSVKAKAEGFQLIAQFGRHLRLQPAFLAKKEPLPNDQEHLYFLAESRMVQEACGEAPGLCPELSLSSSLNYSAGIGGLYVAHREGITLGDVTVLKHDPHSHLSLLQVRAMSLFSEPVRALSPQQICIEFASKKSNKVEVYSGASTGKDCRRLLSATECDSVKIFLRSPL
jgi:hypothetical protein